MNKMRVVAKKVTKAELRRNALRAAMPEVRALCDKHGRSIVLSCVTRISEYEKKAAEVERMRKEAERLEQKLLEASGQAEAVK